MGKCKKESHMPFVVEGELTGVAFRKDGQRLKWLHLATTGGGLSIKLPKTLSPIRSDALNFGDRLRIAGQKKPGSSGKIKFKAEHVLLLSEGQTQQWCLVPEMGLSSGELTLARMDKSEECSRDSPVQSTQIQSRQRQSPGNTTTPAAPVSSSSTCSSTKPMTILICRKSDCQKRGGRKLCAAIEDTLQQKGWSDRVVVKTTGCMKRCKAGPNLVVMPGKIRYSHVNSAQIPEIIREHLG